MIFPLPSPEIFLTEVFAFLEAKQIDVSRFNLDHICYRLESQDTYDQVKSELEKENLLLVESNINRRPISVFKLSNPYLHEARIIDVLELPSPKEGSAYRTGWEHVEFVVDGSLEEFQQSYPDVEFDDKGFSKVINRELRLKAEKLSVKFHENSLEEIIAIEKTLKS